MSAARKCIVIPRSWFVRELARRRTAKRRREWLQRLRPRIDELLAVTDRASAERLALLEHEVALTKRRIVGKELEKCRSLAKELRKRLRPKGKTPPA